MTTATRTLDRLIPDAAHRWADRPALRDRAGACSWDELDRRTAAVASYLVALGVNPGDRVAVHRHKGLPSYEAVHGVLRAGGVVVPIDPRAPAAVAAAVIADAEVSAVIGDELTIPRLGGAFDVPLIESPASGSSLERWEAIASTEPTALPTLQPDAPAYMIYTSGSTGTPKGLIHTHASALAYAAMVVDLYGLEPDDRIAGMNPFHFDMSTLELYAAPLAGSLVVVMNEADLQFPASFTERAEEERTTVWYGVPFFLRQLVERGAVAERDLAPLRWLLYGGEPFPSSALAELMRAVPGARASNVYGPAEVNQCTYFHIEAPPDHEVPIGWPVPGAELVVLGPDRDPVGRGQQGELWVSSPTMTCGYWKRPEMNATRFMTDPDGRRWYATGDVVTRDDGGVLWYRGRSDHQVKIRGVRLELEAVENVLTDAPGVLHAVAGPIGRSGDASHLAAAVVLEAGAELDRAALRRWCRERLPAVAVPHDFTVRNDMPQTPSGKIDRTTVRRQLAGPAGDERSDRT